MPKLIGTTQTFDVDQDIQTTFDWVVHPDAPVVFINGWGPIPGFDAYEITEGDWTQPGSSRKVTLGDGSNVTETIKTVNAPAYFDYELQGFTNPVLKAAFTRAFGQWWFTTREDGGTHVVWTYSFEGRNAVLTPVVWVFVNAIYRRYVKQAVSSLSTISKGEGLGAAPLASPPSDGAQQRV